MMSDEKVNEMLPAAPRRQPAPVNYSLGAGNSSLRDGPAPGNALLQLQSGEHWCDGDLSEMCRL